MFGRCFGKVVRHVWEVPKATLEGSLEDVRVGMEETTILQKRKIRKFSTKKVSPLFSNISLVFPYTFL